MVDTSRTIATTFDVANAATVGNLLTANVASGGDSLGGLTWFPTAHFQSTAVRTTDHAAHGTGSVLATGTAVGFCHFAINNSGTNGLPLNYRLPIKASAAVKRVTGVSGSAKIYVWWFTSSGTACTSAYTVGGSSYINSSTFTTIQDTFVPPADAAYAEARVIYSTGAIGDSVAIDDFGVWFGAGGDWAMPGVPIANLGITVSRPNTDDYLCQQWSSTEGKWVTTRYDSGWRDVTSSVTPPTNVTINSVKLRRVNNLVYVTMDWSAASNASGSGTYTPPGGFAWGGGGNSATPLGFSNVSSATGAFKGGAALGSTGVITIYPVASQTPTFGISYLVDSAIPTSLPGTLISAAPA
jgi:hypothetical protein